MISNDNNGLVISNAPVTITLDTDGPLRNRRDRRAAAARARRRRRKATV